MTDKLDFLKKPKTSFVVVVIKNENLTSFSITQETFFPSGSANGRRLSAAYNPNSSSQLTLNIFHISN